MVREAGFGGQRYPTVREAGFGDGPREKYRYFLLLLCHPGVVQELLPELSLPARPCLSSLPRPHPRHCYHLSSRKTNCHFTEKTLAIPGAFRLPKTDSEGPAHPSAESHRTPQFVSACEILIPIRDGREGNGRSRVAWASSFSSGTCTLRVGAVSRNSCLLERGVLSHQQSSSWMTFPHPEHGSLRHLSRQEQAQGSLHRWQGGDRLGMGLTGDTFKVSTSQRLG